jgi:hypothetical protein
MVVPVAWENGIEGRGKIRAAVTDQEPEVPEPLAEVQGQVAGLLHRPVAGRVGGDAADVQHVQPGQRDSIDVKKVHRQDPDGLRAQELPAGRAVPARRRVNARGAEDLLDGGRRDRNAELGQLAVNTPVAQEWVFLR